MTKEEKVKEIINRYDPAGLLFAGCPDDEYSPEIKDILNSINEEQSKEEVNEIVYKIFVRWFYEDMIKPAKLIIKQASLELYNLMHSK